MDTGYFNTGVLRAIHEHVFIFIVHDIYPLLTKIQLCDRFGLL